MRVMLEDSIGTDPWLGDHEQDLLVVRISVVNPSNTHRKSDLLQFGSVTAAS